jgi:hypothetical protein
MTAICAWVCHAAADEFRAGLAHVPVAISMLLPEVSVTPS